MCYLYSQRLLPVKKDTGKNRQVIDICVKPDKTFPDCGIAFADVTLDDGNFIQNNLIFIKKWFQI